jgi:hypothetical protein
MVATASANYNTIHKVYGGDPNVPLKGKECICFYHWEESLQIHRERRVNAHYGGPKVADEEIHNFPF